VSVPIIVGLVLVFTGRRKPAHRGAASDGDTETTRTTATEPADPEPSA